MKIINITLAIAIIICSCKTKQRKHMADYRGENDGKETNLPLAKNDTINVLEYIEMATIPQSSPAGGSTEELKSRVIVKYDDSNNDTIKATIQCIGVIHPPAIANPTSDKPFEKFENYIFYKVNGEWKAQKNSN